MKKKMKLRCSNGKVAIFFGKSPEIKIREITPETPEELKEQIEQYPFMNKEELKIWVYDLTESVRYEFSIPEGYCFDGATIPKFFWRLIGPNSDPKFLVAAMIHDTLCENKSFIGSDRELSSEIFYALLIASGVGKFKARVMRNAVDLFQRTQGWER